MCTTVPSDSTTAVSTSDAESRLRQLPFTTKDFCVGLQPNELIAVYLSQYEEEEPQIGRVLSNNERDSSVEIEWLTGSYTGLYVLASFTHKGQNSLVQYLLLAKSFNFCTVQVLT